jgi:hypothetical protein
MFVAFKGQRRKPGTNDGVPELALPPLLGY